MCENKRPKRSEFNRKGGIKTAIIVDPMGSSFSTPEEEIESHTRYYSEFIGKPLDVYCPLVFREDVITPDTQLILFDYGGMMPGNSLLEDQSRQIVPYAVDHPSVLIVLVSQMAWDLSMKYDMEDFGHKNGLPNIWVFRGSEVEETIKKLRELFA